MTSRRQKNDNRLSMGKKIAAIATGLMMLYLVIGFWVAPALLKKTLENNLTDLLERKVTIGEVKLNPIVLSLTASDFTVREIDGSPVAGFGELYVNAQVSSLFNWAATFKEIRLSSPFSVLRLMPDNKLNIDDLIARFSRPEPAAEEKQGLLRVIAAWLEVSDGKLTFEDRTLSEPVQDVLTPINFTLKDFSTLEGRKGEFHIAGEGPIGGKFDVKGRLEMNPLQIEGRFATHDARFPVFWEHFRDLLSLQIKTGTLAISGEFFAALHDSGPSLKLKGKVRIKDFELVEKGQQAVLVALPIFSAEGIHLDLDTKDITIDSVQTAGAQVTSWLESDGTFALQQLLQQDLDTLLKKAAPYDAGSAPPSPKPWQVTLKRMTVNDWGLAFEDRTLSNPAKFSVDGLHASVENLSTQKSSHATIGLTMQVNQAGQVKIDGATSLNPQEANMEVTATKIALKPFQPYLDDAVKARISSGFTSTMGRIRYQSGDAQPQILYEGDVVFDELAVQDRMNENDFFSLKQIKVSGLSMELLPNKLYVSEVLVDRPHARVIVDEYGAINVVDAFIATRGEAKSETKNLLQRFVNFLLIKFQGPMPLRVDRIRLEGFDAELKDESVSPPFDMDMEITEGMVMNLSTEPSAKTDFKLNGGIGKTAALAVSGQIMPMNSMQYGKVDLSLKGFSLKSLSPYAGKYIGYAIDQGSLHTDLAYEVKDDAVTGDNVISIDRLKLGDMVKKPHALDLPVKLGLSLLKDENGRIRLQIPVFGNVKDPHFDVAKTIKGALTHTIEQAGRKPFAAIKATDGFAGEELSVIEFGFGTFDLEAKETRKLDALAAYLKAKDDLILTIVGTADGQMDLAAVRQPSSPAGIPSDDAPEKDSAARETIDAGAVDSRRLEDIAMKRAETVKSYLIEQGGLDASRLQMNPVKIMPEPSGEKAFVEFSLSVE